MADKTTADLNQKDPKSYEVGYLLVPFISESEKDASVQKEIRSIIEASGGSIISEREPQLRRLAYEIRKMIGNKYNLFRDAYFGAVKFEAEPAAAEAINNTLRKSEAIIRFLLIESAKGGDSRQPVEIGAAVAATPVEPVAPNLADPEAIDREINDLLTTSS